MSYQKAENILPQEILELVQNYVDGAYLYIPRKNNQKKAWGTNTRTRHELSTRNEEIYKAYLAGSPVDELAETYFLSTKSIQRILLTQKKYELKNPSR